MGRKRESRSWFRVLLPALQRAVESTERALPGWAVSLGRAAPNDATFCGVSRRALCLSWQRSGLSLCWVAIFAPPFSIPGRSSILLCAWPIWRSEKFSSSRSILRHRIFSRSRGSFFVALSRAAPLWPDALPPAASLASASEQILAGAWRFLRPASPPATPARYLPPHGRAQRR